MTWRAAYAGPYMEDLYVIISIMAGLLGHCVSPPSILGYCISPLSILSFLVQRLYLMDASVELPLGNFVWRVYYVRLRLHHILFDSVNLMQF